MTFIDPDDRELQYLFIVFQVGLKATDRDIVLSSEFDKYTWKKLSDIQLNEITQSTQQILGLVQIPFSPNGAQKIIEIDDVKNDTLVKLVAYSDGGSRGNPGPSASGYVLMDERSEIIYEGGAMNGIYKIKKEELAAINRRIQELSARFDKVTYTYVAREYNKLADGMVNKILDQQQ